MAATGRIEPNPQATAEDQDRAARTIASFGLNSGGRPQDRKRVLKNYASLSDEVRAYRFVFGG